MQEKFEQIKSRAAEEISKIHNSRLLSDLKAKFIGKNGEVTSLLRGMKDIPAEQRSSFGKRINDLKCEIEQYFAKKEVEIKEKELEEKYKAEAVDITLPGKTCAKGGLHPLNLVKNQIIDAFSGFGFEIFDSHF